MENWLGIHFLIFLKTLFSNLAGGTAMISSTPLTKLIRFLQDDLAISASSMAIVLKQIERNPGPVPMLLWQYGLVTIEQLDRIYDWIDAT
jgi:Protein of unknown function (DUF2949)